MSSVFRMSLHKGMCLCVSNSNILKNTFNRPFSAISKYKKKTLENFLPQLQQNYRVSTDANKNIHIDLNSDNNERQIIYIGVLKKPVKLIKVLSLSTSSAVLLLTPYAYLQALSNPSTPDLALPLVFSLVGFAFFSPFLYHFITKKYVNAIEYLPEKDEYIAKVYNFFGIEKEIKFTPKDVTIPTIRDPFANCAIGKKHVFFDPKQFSDQLHYIKIMGYDKPFEVASEDVSSKKIK